MFFFSNSQNKELFMTRVRDYDFMVDRVFSDCKLVTKFLNNIRWAA